MTAIYDVYGVGRGAMCGGEEEGVRPASPLSRRHSREEMRRGGGRRRRRVFTHARHHRASAGGLERRRLNTGRTRNAESH